MPVIPQLRRLSLTTVAVVALALVAPSASVADPTDPAPEQAARLASVRAPAVRVTDLVVRQVAPTSVADVRVRFAVRNATDHRAAATDAGVLLVRAGQVTRLGRADVPALGARRSARVRTVAVPAVDLAAGHYRVRVCPGRATSGPGCATTSRPTVTIGRAALAVDPETLELAGTPVGETAAGRELVVTNRGGTSSGALTLAVTGPAADDYVVDPAGCAGPLAPGESCTATVAFTPTAAGSRQARLTVSGATAAPVAVALTGAGAGGAQLSLSPSAATFGSTAVGTASTQTYTVTNAGDAATGALATSVTGTGFSESTSTCETPLSPGATCQVVVRFLPPSAGAQAGRLSVTAAPGGTATSELTGEGVASTTPAPSTPSSPLVVSIDRYDFVAPLGDYTDPAASTEFTVTNSGDDVVDMPGPTFAENAFFFVGSVGGMCGDAHDGVVSLEPGESCNVRIQTLASSRQTVEDTLTIGDEANAVSIPFTVRGVPTDGPNLEIVGPSRIDLGRDLEDDVVRTFTLTNPGGEATGALTLAVFLEQGSGFSLDPDPEAEDACAADQVLEPGESCTFRVRFSPYEPGDNVGLVGAGVFSGDDHPLQAGVRITANAVTPPPTVLTAPPALVISSDPYYYRYDEFTLTNDTDEDIAVAEWDLPDTTHFRLFPQDCEDENGDAVVPAHGSCQVGVTYYPGGQAAHTKLRLLDAGGALLAQVHLVGRPSRW